MVGQNEPLGAGVVAGDDEFLEVRLSARTEEERQKLARLHVRCVENSPSDPFSVRWNVECGVDVSSRRPNGERFRLQVRGLKLVMRERNCQIDHKVVEEEADTKVLETSKTIGRARGGMRLNGFIGWNLMFGGAKAGAEGSLEKQRSNSVETVRKVKPYRVAANPDGWLIGRFDQHGEPSGEAPLTGAYPSWAATGSGATFKWLRQRAECDVEFRLIVPADAKWLLISVDEGAKAPATSTEERRWAVSDLELRARLSEVVVAKQLESDGGEIVLDRAVVVGRRVPPARETRRADAPVRAASPKATRPKKPRSRAAASDDS